MDTIKSKEKILFEKWKNIYPNIVTDGVVNEKEFKNIVYILKEANGGENWDLRDFLAKGGRTATWNNITRWTKGIVNINENFNWSEIEKINEADRMEYLQKIAVINVKKVPGNAISDMDEVNLFTEKHKKILQKQINLYNPKIIVCCGIGSDLFDNIFNKIKWQMTNRGIWYLYNDSTILINYFHPQARIKSYFLYYGLIDAIKEIIITQNSKLQK